MSLNNFAQVRSQLVRLCNQERFPAAHMYLLGSGHPPERFPGLWEYLARRSSLSKDGVIAHEARHVLWQAGMRSEDIALREAEYFIEKGDWKSAIFVLEEVFGKAPDNRVAHFRLAEAHLLRARQDRSTARLQTSRDIALAMDAGHVPETASEALVVIDLLRFSGSLERARRRIDDARKRFPGDARVDLRAARVLEQLRDPNTAIAEWERIAEQHPRYRIDALLKIYHLNAQLDRQDDMAKVAARLVLADLPLNARMELAILTRQRGMIEAIARLAALNGTEGADFGYEESLALTDKLMENGDIGLTVWLRRQRLPVSDATKAKLASVGFGEGGIQALPDTYQEAAQLRSPDFMLPLHAHLHRTPKPSGWPGRKTQFDRVLLVNSSLVRGGAERQFVALVKALLDHGVAREKIHCAFFSLAPDRGADAFLPQMQELGVALHDLRDRHVANPSMPPQEAAVIDVLPVDIQDNARALWHLVRDLEPDTIHAWQDHAGLVSAIVGELAQTERVILSTRNLAPDTRGELRLMEMRALYRDFLTRDNCTITANSVSGAKDYARWLDTDASDLPLLTNAVDMAALDPGVIRKRPRWKDGQRFVLGGVFRLASNKRPLLWLQTVAALRHVHGLDFRPVLFGAGPLEQDIRNLASELGLTDLEIITDTSDPAVIYGDLDAMLLMSRVEGLPNVVLEAQASGVPVAACDVGGVSEALLQRGRGAGLLLKRDISADAAAGFIAPWLAQALSGSPGARRAFVARAYAPDAIAKAAVSLYLKGTT